MLHDRKERSLKALTQLLASFLKLFKLKSISLVIDFDFKLLIQYRSPLNLIRHLQVA